MQKSIPKIRERERNEKNPFSQFGKAEQGHHVPVRDHEVDHGMGVGVGGKDAPEELTCCPKNHFVSVCSYIGISVTKPTYHSITAL